MKKSGGGKIQDPFDSFFIKNPDSKRGVHAWGICPVKAYKRNKLGISDIFAKKTLRNMNIYVPVVSTCETHDF